MVEPTKPKNLPIKFGKVTNPTSEDLHFSWDNAPYILKAGDTEERWPEYLAIHAAKKLADKNILTNDPQEHRVLMGAYLENSDIEVIAKRLNIDLEKIREEAMTKEKEKAKVLNLEAQMAEERKKREELEKKLDAVLKTKGDEKESKPPEQEEKPEEEAKEVKEDEKDEPAEVKTYRCKECDEEFSTPLALARHVKSHK